MNFIFNLSWLQILLSVIGLLFLSVFWKFVRLWFYLQSLKKKGAIVYFSSPLGFALKLESDTKKGDTYAYFKEVAQKYSN